MEESIRSGKEMSKVKVAWKVADDYSPDQVRAGKATTTLIGYQEIIYMKFLFYML